MALTQFDVDQQQQTLRQAALGNVLGGIQGLDQQSKTKRAQALDDQKTAFEYRKAGYEVSPEMIAQTRAEEPGMFAKLFGAESPEKVDLYANRTSEWKNKQAAETEEKKFKRTLAEADLKFKQENALLDRDYKTAQMGNMAVENQKKKAETEKLRREGINGKQMSATEVAKFDEGNQIPVLLQDIKSTINNNQGSFGPVAGRVATLNPWDEKAQTIDSQMRTASQAFGKFMEGGVLRKEDEDKYRKMFPNQSDTPEVAANKLANVERLLAVKQNSTIEALRGGGYDVGSIDKGLKVPDAPGVLSGNTRTGTWGNNANADPNAFRQQLKGISREEKIRMLQGK